MVCVLNQDSFLKKKIWYFQNTIYTKHSEMEYSWLAAMTLKGLRNLLSIMRKEEEIEIDPLGLLRFPAEI